ncbi:hypothetical protein [uncultured Kriegella sp.]|uniref:hypothetical protein n=1 Tax=uncultured Kriegella sp. TaxID=1798910 RepID=UPI0030D8A04C|tara:strand:+ start:77240 stop:77836 length:597 start_codon:yes stop_codon:yes gene_type:complete
MNLEKEQIIKSKLGLILKVLLITLVLFKIADFAMSHYGDTPSSNDKREVISTPIDSTKIPRHSTTGVGRLEAGAKPLENTASIYIFGENGLDSQASRHVGSIFFDDYKLTATPDGLQKEKLLSGDFHSAANTELVCVGKVSYSYKTDDQKNTCELTLYFDTYNKVTGEKIKALSKAMVRYGIGFSNSQAKQVAMGKVH